MKRQHTNTTSNVSQEARAILSMAGLREHLEAADYCETNALIVLLEKMATGHSVSAARVQIWQAIPTIEKLAAEARQATGSDKAQVAAMIRAKEQLARLAASPALAEGFKRPH